MRRLVRISPLFLLLALVFTTAGCDAIAEKLGIDKVNVPLSSAGSLAVRGDTPDIQTSSVSRDGGSLPNVFDIKSVTITPADVSWTTASKVSASGQVFGVVLVKSDGNWIPFVNATIGITNDVVSSVNVQMYSLDATTEAVVGRLAASERPDLSAAKAMSTSQRADKVEKALRNNPIEVALVVFGTAGLNGSVTINKMQVNLDF